MVGLGYFNSTPLFLFIGISNLDHPKSWVDIKRHGGQDWMQMAQDQRLRGDKRRSLSMSRQF